jgi:hypothetical protein
MVKKNINEKYNFNDVCGYFDVDWAENFDRKSTTSFYTFICKKLVT